MGDVNLLNKTPFVTDYKNAIARNAFFSAVNIPTRVTETPKTAIDHILTNITSEEIKPGVLQTNISDHFPTFAYISKLKISYNIKHEMFRRNQQNFNSESFADCVSMKLKIYFDNLEHINKNNINKVCENFVQLIKDEIENFVPLTNLSGKQKKLVKNHELLKASGHQLKTNKDYIKRGFLKEILMNAAFIRSITIA